MPVNLYNLEEKSKELSGNIGNAGNNVLQRSRDLVNMQVDKHPPPPNWF